MDFVLRSFWAGLEVKFYTCDKCLNRVRLKQYECKCERISKREGDGVREKEREREMRRSE